MVSSSSFTKGGKLRKSFFIMLILYIAIFGFKFGTKAYIHEYKNFDMLIEVAFFDRKEYNELFQEIIYIEK